MPATKLSVVQAMRDYVTKMISDTSGMKILLLDKDTTGFVSMVYTQSEILAKEVYLVERLDTANRERMQHLRAVVFVRPTAESVNALVQELKVPKYGQYHVYFSNTLDAGELERLADADALEVVKEVQEFYGDFVAINAALFSLNQTRCAAPAAAPAAWEPRVLERSLSGLLSTLLALRRRPVVRFQKSSPLCRRLAHDVHAAMKAEGSLFDFRRADVPPVLLIVDRRDDPVTPLLTQWTYQAMVHELMGIANNRVDLSGVPDVRAELREIVLSAEQDSFFAANMYRNFGDICMAIKKFVDDFQQHTKNSQNIESIDDMKRFIEDYPQFRQMSGAVSKHVTVVGELSRAVDAYSLLEVSEVEQELACGGGGAGGGDHASVLARIRQLVAAPRVRDRDRLRLVCLYALRYERHASNDVAGLRAALPPHDAAFVDALLGYAGHAVRSSDLFGNKSISAFAKKALKGLKGVTNIYTQHQPLLAETLDQLLKGKLREGAFPFVGTSLRDRPAEVIVFMVGGATYQEGRLVDELQRNAATAAGGPGVRLILGGTTVHNATSFLDEAAASVGK